MRHLCEIEGKWAQVTDPDRSTGMRKENWLKRVGDGDDDVMTDDFVEDDDNDITDIEFIT